MSLEGGTTLTSLVSDSAMATRRFSLLLPFGYACGMQNEHELSSSYNDVQKEKRAVKPPHLAGVKVGEREQVLQVEEPLRLRLLQHDHGVRLPEERTSGAHLPHLDELHHHLAERGSGCSSRADVSKRDGRGGTASRRQTCS